MTRTWLIGLALAAAAGTGCGTYSSARSMRGTPRPDDPRYADKSIEAQEARGRARYGLIEDDFRIGPKTYSDRPDPVAGGVGGGLGPGSH